MTVKKAKKAVKRTSAVDAGPQKVTVMVNGEVTGTIPDDVTIGAASEKIATQAGLRSFSIKLDGKKIEHLNANKTLKGVTTIELFAKDARGQVA